MMDGVLGCGRVELDMHGGGYKVKSRVLLMYNMVRKTLRGSINTLFKN